MLKEISFFTNFYFVVILTILRVMFWRKYGYFYFTKNTKGNQV
jgi:hypothetical protein